MTNLDKFLERAEKIDAIGIYYFRKLHWPKVIAALKEAKKNFDKISNAECDPQNVSYDWLEKWNKEFGE